MITFISRPDEVSAAYLPVKYVLTSDRFPNTRAGEAATIKTSGSAIGEPNQSIIFMSGSLSDAETTVPVIAGDRILIQNSLNGLLDGVHKIAAVGTNPAIISFEKVYPYATTINDNGDVSIYYDKFSVVADVYVNGQLRHRSRRQANPDGQFAFDLSETVKKYVGSDLQAIGADTFAAGSESIASFYIDYAEEYIVFSPTTGDDLFLGTFLSDIANAKQAINATIQYADIRNLSVISTTYDLSDYTITPISAGKFLTKQPSTIKIGSSEEYQLMAIIQKTNTNILGNNAGTDGTFESGTTPTIGAGVTSPPLANFLVTETDPRTEERSLRVVSNGAADNLWTSDIGGTIFVANTIYKVTGWVRFDVPPSTNKEAFEVQITSQNFADGVTTIVQTVDGTINTLANTWYYMETTLQVVTDIVGELVCQITGADRANMNDFVMFFDDIKIEKKTFDIQREVEAFDSAGASLGTTTTAILAANSTYIISAGTNNLSLNLSTAKYTVKLVDTDTSLDISDTLTFEIDSKCTRNALRFAWVNDKGGIDEHTFRGELVESDEIARETFKRELNDNRTIPERQLTESFVMPQSVYVIGSGLIDKETVDFVRGIYRSPEKYIIIDGQYLPVFVRDTSPAISNSSNRLSSISMEWQFSFDEIVQTN